MGTTLKIKDNAVKEYLKDNLKNQAEESINDRFKDKLKYPENANKINCYFLLSIASLFLYFFAKPIYLSF